MDPSSLRTMSIRQESGSNHLRKEDSKITVCDFRQYAITDIVPVPK